MLIFLQFSIGTQKVTKSDYERFEIDRILKTRKRNGKIQYFVAWKGCSYIIETSTVLLS